MDLLWWDSMFLRSVLANGIYRERGVLHAEKIKELIGRHDGEGTESALLFQGYPAFVGRICSIVELQKNSKRSWIACSL